MPWIILWHFCGDNTKILEFTFLIWKFWWRNFYIRHCSAQCFLSLIPCISESSEFQRNQTCHCQSDFSKIVTQIPHMRFVLFNTCMGKSPPHRIYKPSNRIRQYRSSCQIWQWASLMQLPQILLLFLKTFISSTLFCF